MILEIPSADDYARASASALNLAWDVAVALTSRFRIAVDVSGFDEDEVSDNYWRRAQQQLGNAVGLVQQGFELGMKGRIAAVSPYLLLLSSSPDSLPRVRKGGVPFGDLRTIDAKDLIRVHDVFCTQPIPAWFRAIFEANRTLRNQFIHGLVQSSRITELKIYADVLAGHYLLGTNGETWPQVRRKYLDSASSESVVDDVPMPLGRVLMELSRVVDALPRKVLLDYLGFDKKVQRYVCPADCHEEMRGSDFHDYLSSKPIQLAHLAPNSPESTTLYCVGCHTTSQVIRTKCCACTSDVLGTTTDACICLSCGAEQPAEEP